MSRFNGLSKVPLALKAIIFSSVRWTEHEHVRTRRNTNERTRTHGRTRGQTRTKVSQQIKKFLNAEWGQSKRLFLSDIFCRREITSFRKKKVRQKYAYFDQSKSLKQFKIDQSPYTSDKRPRKFCHNANMFAYNLD